ncbi:MAG: type I DNA topoisomerase [Clostridium sp.]|nr:type I DNA topoisomerase [Clostridium sp.]
MVKNLVIVESPAKAKTIEKFLGKDFRVMSSYGHIRDLKKKDFSLNPEGGFTPEYEIPEDKRELVRNLRRAASEAETVWLASDEDREGEAIAWHLSEVLGLDPKTTKRIVFHEITKDAILNAIANPRTIDLNRVDAQQARRVLDRIVGFELSPVLWKKIKPALSAGRVQSVAVRLIAEREAEIKNFVPEQYFRISGRFATPDGSPVKAEYSRRATGKDEARQVLEQCAGKQFEVASVTVRPVSKSPAPPFTTSTLQQEAARRLGFSVSMTMSVAQRLYEAGHITYMRTDSLNLSQIAMETIKNEVIGEFGEEYYKRHHYHTSSKGAQEAHEAIRPTYVSNRTIEGTPQEQRLYALIWKRTVASQMADAILEKTTAEITDKDGDHRFTATGETIKFDGYLSVYLDTDQDTDTGLLPPMAKGDRMEPLEITALERLTQQPPRYTEGSLVKKMEDLGIGRPSTYAPTIQTIQQRGYVEKGDRPGTPRDFALLTLSPDGTIAETVHTENSGSDKGKLIPTDIGVIVNDFLTEFFPNILDYNFTANVEARFDEIAEGNAGWHDEISDFYDVFHPEVDRANNMRFEHKVGERVLGTDPATGEPVSVKIGRFGPVVQIGDSAAETKPRFASLRKDQSVFDLTLEEALKLFDFPRHLGEFEGKEVTVGVGRFGPYVKHDGKFVSIPKEISPTEINLDQAEELINARRESDSKKTVKTFDEDPEMMILNGRYGVYISYKKSNYKIPKSVADPAALTYDEALEIVKAQDAKPKRSSRSSKK